LESSDTAEIAFDNVETFRNLMGEEEKVPILCKHFVLERLIMAINAHAS
jgi:hypothetical protein